jgi:hypothetical protein
MITDLSPGLNGPTDQPNPARPTDRPCARRARPAHVTHPTPRHLTGPVTPDPAHPNPALPDNVPLPLPPHASPVDEHRFLLYLTSPHHWRAPLPPPLVASPANAPASSAPHRPTGECRVPLHPAPFPPPPLPPPPLCLTK